MPQPVKKDIWFSSADKRNQVAGYFYTAKGVAPFCILQIAHGMCEYIARYEEFAGVLANNGIVVCGNDHLGHGATAKTEEDYGYFGEKGGRRFAIQDMHTMNLLAHQEYPGLPLVLLGHSMGSFLSRRYVTEYPDTVDGFIISGTGGPNPLAGIGMAVASLMGALRGRRCRSQLVHNMAFGAYLKQIEAPRTPYDWISRDEAIVDIYAADPLCTFRFTANGFHELFAALKEVSSPAWAVQVRKDLPILLISGDADPVGDYGRGVQQVYEMLKNAGVKDVKLVLYPGARHEVLNETNREEVYDDVLAFLDRWRPAP